MNHTEACERRSNHSDGEHDFYEGPKICTCEKIELNKETAEELLLVLNHNFIPYEYILVHAFIKRCWEFTGSK